MRENYYSGANGEFLILIRTYAGLEETLADEVRALGGGDASVITRGVECTGDLGFVYKLNLGLRTGLRVLVPLTSFLFRSNKDFYKKIYDLPWNNFMEVDQSIRIDSLLFGDMFNNSMFVSQLTKDAIVDRFREDTGKRPFIDTRTPHIYISVYVNDNRAIVYLDSSGTSLHRRGYRQKQVEAPLSEVMAAGILRLSGWTHHFPLLDPMCGSGTFSIEAALMANNIPPGIFRDGFAFENWKGYDGELFQKILDSLNSRIGNNSIEIYASDKSRRAVEMAKANAKEAGVDEDITFKVSSFESTEGNGRKTFLFLNPPYGERLDIKDEEETYGSIGTTLKHRYQGSEAWIFTSNQEGIKFVGLKPKKKIKLYNGPLECVLVGYQLYSGSLKQSKIQ